MSAVRKSMDTLSDAEIEKSRLARAFRMNYELLIENKDTLNFEKIAATVSKNSEEMKGIDFALEYELASKLMCLVVDYMVKKVERLGHW